MRFCSLAVCTFKHYHFQFCFKCALWTESASYCFKCFFLCSILFPEIIQLLQIPYWRDCFYFWIFLRCLVCEETDSKLLIKFERPIETINNSENVRGRHWLIVAQVTDSAPIWKGVCVELRKVTVRVWCLNCVSVNPDMALTLSQVQTVTGCEQVGHRR